MLPSLGVRNLNWVCQMRTGTSWRPGDPTRWKLFQRPCHVAIKPCSRNHFEGEKDKVETISKDDSEKAKDQH